MASREVHPRAMEILDSGEKRLNELGYKQELRREMVYIYTYLIVFIISLISFKDYHIYPELVDLFTLLFPLISCWELNCRVCLRHSQ